MLGRRSREANIALEAARRNTGKADVQSKLDAAYQAWCDRAERDLVRVTGYTPPAMGTRGRKPKVRWRSVLPETKPMGKESKASILTWLRGAAQEVSRLASALAEGAGDGLYIAPPFRGGNMPHGGTFATPVRGGYNEASAREARPTRRGGRPRPPIDRGACINVLREVLEDLADGSSKLSIHTHTH